MQIVKIVRNTFLGNGPFELNGCSEYTCIGISCYCHRPQRCEIEYLEGIGAKAPRKVYLERMLDIIYDKGDLVH